MEGKPYDRLFRRAFGTPEAARDLARNLLPADYAGLLDRAEVALDQGSIVDPALRTHQTDLLQTLARAKRYAVVREDVMTYAEELLKEGLEQGLEQGELRDKQQVLVRQLTRRFGLSDAERERIESCEDRDALDAALDEFAVAQAKEAVLAKLGPGGGSAAG